MREYTKQEITAIKRRFRNRGEAMCMELFRRLGSAENEAVMSLKKRCPLAKDGTCTKCADKLAAGGIDMFQAVRDLGLIADQFPDARVIDEERPMNTPFLERALSIIEGMIHPDELECRLDHHGYCQEHLWFFIDPPCPVKRAKELFDELGREI